MTTEDAFNIIKAAGQRNRNVALSIIKNNYSTMREVYDQLIRIVQQMIHSPSALSPSTQSALTSVASRIQAALNPPSATTQEQMVKKEGPIIIRTAETRGDNSDQHQSVEQTRPNGLSVDSDQAHHNICTAPTNNDHTTQDRTKSTGGDEGSDTGGAKSEREAEKSVIVTTPNIVQNNPVAAANNARKEITAAKSSFNDNRDSCIFSAVDDLLSIPSEILSAITKIDEDKDDAAEMDGDLESDNIFVGLVDSVTKELGKITLAISQFTADSALKKAELVIKNKTEKLATIRKRIEEMDEGAVKEKYLEALFAMDLNVLFGDPASENMKKQTIRDKDEEVKMAVNATEKALEAEVNIN